MSDVLITPYATLSFPVLFSPKPRSEGGEPEYHCSLLFAPEDQKTPEFKALQQAVTDAAKAKFGDKTALKSLVLPFHDGVEKADKYKGYEAGVIYISPHSKQKPGIVDVRLQDVLDPEEVWAGQLVRAHVNAFAWRNTGKQGVSFGLNNIQLVKRSAPRLDNRIAANKAFGALEEENDSADIPF